jgi:hypothetical protein
MNLQDVSEGLLLRIFSIQEKVAQYLIMIGLRHVAPYSSFGTISWSKPRVLYICLMISICNLILKTPAAK